MENSVLNKNRRDPDKTPPSASFDLGLHCLLMSLLRDTAHKKVNLVIKCICSNYCLKKVKHKLCLHITKTRLFKYTENFTPKN